MSDNVTRVGRGVRSLKSAPQFDGYTRVVIVQNENYEYSVGTDEGRTLKLENPWATQSMAKNILESLRGFQYQPYSAPGAILDPAAEIGDGVVVSNLYGGIYRKKITFGPDYRADISAPGEEEINHEYEYKPKQDRKVSRQLANLTSELQIQAGKISAKVSMTGGEAESFGWELDEKSWTIQANGSNVIEVDRTGLTVRGHVYADEGLIGGFLLQNNALSTNGQTFGGTNSRGLYIGPSGIQLGDSFKVDAYGNLEATSGKFTGKVYAGNIQYGSSAGYFNGSGIATETIYGSSIAQNTISTRRTNEGINTSLGYADYAGGVFGGWNRASQIATDQLSADEILLEGKKFGMSTISYVGADDKTHSINVVTWKVR